MDGWMDDEEKMGTITCWQILLALN